MKRGSPVGPTEASVYAYTEVGHSANLSCRFSILHLFMLIIACACKSYKLVNFHRMYFSIHLTLGDG